MPERIQLRRTKGWRLPEGAVSVARPTKWGNPYTVAMMRKRIEEVREAFPDDEGIDRLDPQEMAAEAFYADLTRGPDSRWWWYGPHMDMIRICGSVSELRGKDLACWCPLDQPCHADALLEIANA